MREGTEVLRHRGTEGGWQRGVVCVVVCVAAGAVVTALVAAASLLYAPTTAPRGVFSSMAVEGAPGSAVFEPGQVYRGVGIDARVDYWWWIPDIGPGEPTHTTGTGVSTVNVGWPLLAFTSPRVRFAEATSYAEFQAATTHAARGRTTTAAPDFLRARPHRVVPGRILPLGFAVNTVLYAAVAGVLLFAPGLVRRGLRRRGGRCVGCGYPLTGGERCPECGGAVSGEGTKARRHRGTEGVGSGLARGGHRGRRGWDGSRWLSGGNRRVGSSACDLGGTPFVPLCLCAFVPSKSEVTP